jgi:alkanesulfonate monooxygenase SsuD/methylene tetrahydromethanopterin reductase-like flavin-dependent oxidoreductase (luciferase family)
MLLGQDDNEIIMLKNNIDKWKKTVAILGTPNDIIGEIKRYMVSGGVRYFTIHFPDLPDLRSLNLFAKSVIPHFRNKLIK